MITITHKRGINAPAPNCCSTGLRAPTKITPNTPDIIIENNRAKYGTPAEAVSRKISEDLQKGRQEVAEKSERREESSLDILVSPKKERKAPNLEELREALSKSISKDKQAEDQ